MIAVVDYGMGNLRSVQKGLERSGAEAIVTSDPAVILRARGVVLPGVGAFGACMDNLSSRGLVEPIREVVAERTPFLGICLGLQLLFEESEEFGPVRGLGVLHGRVRRFAGPEVAGLKVPQIGWNQIQIRRPAPELEGIDDGAFVYFVHSYFVEPTDPSLVATTTVYGTEFASAVVAGNVFACQFHPEKSQAVGLRLLANFARRVASS
jgi:glutamine amidotransferase